MTRETKVAAIPDIREDNVIEVLRAIKNVLQVREGHIGDALDQNATLRDLVDLDILKTGGTTSFTNGAQVAVIPSQAKADGYNPYTDYTTPPAPTGLTATGGFTNVYLQWDGAPYKNHSYAEIWRGSANNLSLAILIGTTASNVYADPAAGNTTYYYWIRFVSVANVTGAYNSTSGTSATTAIDVSSAYDDIYANTVASSDANAGVPFIYLTSPLTIGSITYPAGTWIKNSFIANATIDSAKIKDLVADKITTGSLTAAVGITTGQITGGVNTAYSFGSSNFGTGFFLGLDSSVYKFRVGSYSKNMTWDGTDLTVAGTISASSATFRGLTVTDNSGNILLSSAGIPSSVVTGLGTLATQNSVSAGQVSGLGTLATANSVFIGSNVQIYNGSSYVTLNTGDFVNYLSKITSSTIVNFMGPSAITDAYIGNLNASKITAGTIAADRLDASVINAKVTNIDAAVIQSGTIANARIGDLYAKKIYCGNAATAVDFVDPGYTGVALRSHAVGYLYYSGDTGSSVYVPATCLDYDGYPYDCSYYTYGAAIITGDTLKFKCVDSGWGIDRRVRTGVVQFFVTATVTVDHYFSLWYRINGGSWVNIGQAIEQAAGYGTVGLQWSGAFTAAAGNYVEFGMSATNASLSYWNSSYRDILYGSITVTAINF